MLNDMNCKYKITLYIQQSLSSDIYIQTYSFFFKTIYFFPM